MQVLAEQRKDEFISMTSHELKTPVTSLKGFTNVLQRRLAKQGDEQSLYYLAHPSAEETARASGAEDFLAKPFEIDELLAKVTRYL